MKNGIYLLLGLMVIIRSNGIKGQTPYCKYDDETTQLEANCYHMSDIEALNVTGYFPVTNLSTQISSLTLQTNSAPNSKWYIDSFDYFTRFDNLFMLRIYGPMTFAKDLLSENLRQNLLNIPSLKTLHLFNNQFNGNEYMWELPPGLKNLTIISNDYTEFNLNRNPNLESVNFQQTHLASMPLLSQPPPPLTMVDFRNNPLLEITANDLALFCHANTMNFDEKNLQKSDQYCECMRIKKWIQDILKQPEEKIFNKTLTCNNATNHNCENYTLDKAIRNREDCLMAKLPDVDEEYRAGAMKSFGMQFYVILGSVIVVLTAVGLAALVTFKYFLAAPTEYVEAERKVDDDIKLDDDDDEDDDDEGSGNDDDEHEEDEPTEYSEYK